MPTKTFLIRHRWPVLAAAYSAAMVLFLAKRAIDRFRYPVPLWMTEFPRWYDDALGAGLFAVAAAASVAYLRRRWREAERVPAPDRDTGPTPWRGRVELRVVLYCLAMFLALQCPLAVLQTLWAMHAGPPPWAGTFGSLFPTGGWLYPMLGAAIVLYDRRRIRREALLDLRTLQSRGDDRPAVSPIDS